MINMATTSEALETFGVHIRPDFLAFLCIKKIMSTHVRKHARSAITISDPLPTGGGGGIGFFFPMMILS